MTSRIARIFVAALMGAALGGAALVVAYALAPALTMDMDRPAPPVVTGLYGEERVERDTYAWTSDTVTMTLDGLDRRLPWACTVRLRGGRADVTTLPEVVLAVDGIVERRLQTTNDFVDLTFTVPARDRTSGAILTLTSSNTFMPEADRRTLGVVVDRWTCTPAEGRWPIVPGAPLMAAMGSGAALGAAAAIAGLSLPVSGALLLALAVLQAVPLSWDFGAYGRFPADGWLLALGIAGTVAAGARATESLRGRPLSGPARFVVVVTGIVLFLKMLVLMHPSKPVVDAVFHAHRLQWILEGRWFFTQPMPSGVRFPYAIGLYVFTVPWTVLTDDFVWLLRLVVTAAEAAGGLLVYALVARTWGDRALGAVAAVFFAVVPRTFEIVGNANLTNAFGQSVAFAVLAAAILWPLTWRQWRPWLAFMLLTAFALLCHISTITLLGAILFFLAAAYWISGDRALRGPAISIATALAAAAVLAVAVYYGHFGDAYRSAARVQAAGEGAAAALAAAPFGDKLGDAARLTVAAVGWPLFLLAVPGAVVLAARRQRDRLTLAILALFLTFGLFAVGVVLAPVEQSFQRYAAEFFSRVTLATYPAVVLCAALAAVTGWRAGGVLRGVTALLVAASVLAGVREWVQWLR
jgi:hypothetical protein